MTDSQEPTEARTAWAIVQGEYSDFHVKCICPTKADAEAILARAIAAEGPGGDEYSGTRLAEYPLLTADNFQIVRHVLMRANFDDDGTVIDESEWSTMVWPGDDTRPPVSWAFTPRHATLWSAHLRVGGTDVERVRKVYGDRKAMLQTDDAMRTQRAQG